MARTQDYSIATAARLTGLSIDTIRAWERRYGLVRPRRDANGIRLYSEGEIARLTLARTATKLGHSIGRIAALDDAAVSALIDASAPDEPAAVLPDTERIVETLLAALQRGDAQRLTYTVSSAAVLLAPDDLVLRVFVPLLQRVGELWSAGNLSIWQEHLLSELITSTTATFARSGSRSATAFLFATPPEELHAFGTAFAAMLASSRGYRAYNLGPSIPAGEIVAAATRLNVRYVVVGMTRRADQRSAAALEYLRELDRSLPHSIGIWVGGRGVSDILDAANAPRLRAIPTLDAFAQAISSGTD